MQQKPYILFIIAALLMVSKGYTQEENPFVSYDLPTQNLLKFNRYLLNPTFSTVQEDKSYISLFHRNQSANFDNNNQTYFLSYSGRVGDRSGVGLSLYTQKRGLIDNFGVLANYAYGVRLSEKSNLTFGGNFSYYNSALNQDRANPVDLNDPLLQGLDGTSLITFQPGFNLSFGQIDFGVMADNLFDYNLKSSEQITNFNEKTYTGHLQYTHRFKNASGMFESGRLMPMARVRSVAGEEIQLGGSLILDLPKIGWFQAGYDDFYGAAAGLGFNLGNRISLGYTMEKGLTNTLQNLGVTHEISLAYSFTPSLTEDRVMLEDNEEELVNNDKEIEELSLTEKDLKIAELEKRLAKNESLLDELMLRQDSVEKSRESDLERRFNLVMQMVKRETQGNRPDLEARAEKVFRTGNVDATVADLAANKTNRPITKIKDLAQPVTKQNYTTNSAKDKTNYTQPKAKTKHYIPNIPSGHYLIANVYRNTNYRDAFIEKLRKEGLEASYFTNPKNGMDYVYLKGFNSQQEALEARKNQLNGSYSDNTWVMSIEGSEDQLAQNNYQENTSLSKNVLNEEATKNPTYETIETNGSNAGYYIIANVFANPENARRFIKKLNAKGLNAGYFINPENNYRYVYLKKHMDWTNALVSYYSRLDSTYDDDMWIMRVRSS